MSFASAMAVVTLNVHFRGLRGSEVPKSVKKIFLGGLAKIVFMQFNPTYHIDKSTDSGTFQDRIKVSRDHNISAMKTRSSFRTASSAKPQQGRREEAPMSAPEPAYSRWSLCTFCT